MPPAAPSKLVKPLSATVTIGLEGDDRLTDYYGEVLVTRPWALLVRIDGRKFWLQRQMTLVERNSHGDVIIYIPESVAAHNGLSTTSRYQREGRTDHVIPASRNSSLCSGKPAALELPDFSNKALYNEPIDEDMIG